MTSSGETGVDTEDNPDPSNESIQSSMHIHPTGYSGMPMHMYPFPPGHLSAQPIRSKRKQVKNACTNCQKACKKCDDARPCLRCVKYGMAEGCMDSQRKERRKGVKRGPYKKRDGKDRAGNNVEEADVAPIQQSLPITTGGLPSSSSTPPTGTYIGPVGYPPGFHSQYLPPPPPSKPGEAPAYYPQFFITPIPAQLPPQGHDGESHGYPPQVQFYPATFISPYPQPYPPPYMMHPHPDGQVVANTPYPPYPPVVYAKPPTADNAAGHEDEDAENS